MANPAVDHDISIFEIVAANVPDSATDIHPGQPPDDVRTDPMRYSWEDAADMIGIAADTLRKRRFDKVKEICPYPLQDNDGLRLEAIWLMADLQAWCYTAEGKPALAHELWQCRYRELYATAQDPQPQPTGGKPEIAEAELVLEFHRPTLSIVPSSDLALDLEDTARKMRESFQSTLRSSNARLIALAQQDGKELGAQMAAAKLNAALSTYEQLNAEM